MDTPAIILFFAIIFTFASVNSYIIKTKGKLTPFIVRTVCAFLWSYLFHLLN